MSFWRPALTEVGPTRLGRWMLRLHLGWLARPFGIGMHSDAQLKRWACARERDAALAYFDALHELSGIDRAGMMRVANRNRHVHL